MDFVRHEQHPFSTSENQSQQTSDSNSNEDNRTQVAHPRRPIGMPSYTQ
ncbi:hypothetical protein [Psychrobacter sp. FDAARGOS_221]|nr:hypothetical protein [Psychrobacter sp. FDAARGOS_221]